MTLGLVAHGLTSKFTSGWLGHLTDQPSDRMNSREKTGITQSLDMTADRHAVIEVMINNKVLISLPKTPHFA